MTINSALENCDTCANAGTIAGSAANNSTTVNTGDVKDSFTYNEGNGVKDKIMLTGPMSEFYTQALATVFAKKSMDAEGNIIPEVTPADIATKPAVESMITGPGISPDAALAEVHLATQPEHVGDYYDYAQIEQDPENVTVSGYFLSDSQALQPEIVEQVQQHIRDSNKRVIVVVVASPSGINQATHLKTKFIEVDTMGHQSMFDTDNELSVAREALYDAQGITIVQGVRGFFKELLKTAKRPAA